MLTIPSLEVDAIVLQKAIEEEQTEAMRRGDRERVRLLTEALQHASRVRAILSDPRLVVCAA